MQPIPLSVVIRAALADRGVNSLRDAAEALRDNDGRPTLSKDALRRRYEGITPWTVPDVELVAAYLGITASELYARTESAA